MMGTRSPFSLSKKRQLDVSFGTYSYPIFNRSSIHFSIICKSVTPIIISIKGFAPSPCTDVLPICSIAIQSSPNKEINFFFFYILFLPLFFIWFNNDLLFHFIHLLIIIYYYIYKISCDSHRIFTKCVEY